MMNVDEYKLPLKKVIEEFELEKIYETDDLDSVMITNTDVNRPGLQMVGFFDYFDNNRIQILGKVEFTYLEQFHADERAEKIEKLMSQHIPALIVTRGLQIFPEMIELAEKYNVPLLRSESGTSAFMSALIAYLNVQLAPRRTRHGVLVEVYGASALQLSQVLLIEVAKYREYHRRRCGGRVEISVFYSCIYSGVRRLLGRFIY